jgi:hypothetical protein
MITLHDLDPELADTLEACHQYDQRHGWEARPMLDSGEPWAISELALLLRIGRW